ncbi:MAG TPA: hypothetical protein VGF77_08475 [Allosphingosinicella sp.]|jgi:hypothetical protein
MPLKIGDKSFSTSKPDDLDGQLLASAGCNAGEMAGMLAGAPLASTVAQAARPFLGKDAPDVPALADAIDRAGIEQVRRDVLALYSSPAAAPASVSAPKDHANG